jgi:hypothetical protein
MIDRVTLSWWRGVEELVPNVAEGTSAVLNLPMLLRAFSRRAVAVFPMRQSWGRVRHGKIPRGRLKKLSGRQFSITEYLGGGLPVFPCFPNKTGYTGSQPHDGSITLRPCS